MTTDHARLIVNAVYWALGKPPQVEIAGRGPLDIALHEGEGGQAVAMVNLINPMTLRPPIREVYPVGPFTCSGDRVSFEMSNFEAIEVAHLSWSGAKAETRGLRPAARRLYG